MGRFLPSESAEELHHLSAKPNCRGRGWPQVCARQGTGDRQRAEQARHPAWWVSAAAEGHEEHRGAGEEEPGDPAMLCMVWWGQGTASLL